jgi:hypothetical protein
MASSVTRRLPNVHRKSVTISETFGKIVSMPSPRNAGLSRATSLARRSFGLAQVLVASRTRYGNCSQAV